MSVIRMNSVTKKYGSKTVLHNIYFKLDEGEKIGLLGKNGSGKTTLFKLLLGTEEADEGKIEIDEDLRFGYFSQFSELNGDDCILDILDREFVRVHELEKALSDIEAEIVSCSDKSDEREMTRLINCQMSLFSEMDLLDGWNYQYKIATVLSKLNFSDVYQNLPVSQLSGGWRNRASLALLLIQNPDVILLDEPTNFLDSEGVKWLAEWIKKLPAAVIVVSHDRYFLDVVSMKIVEIENNRLYEYSGDYEEYVRQKRNRRDELASDFEHEEELLLMEENAIKDRAELHKMIKNGDSENSYLERKMANINKKLEPLPSQRIVTSLYYDLYVPEKTVSVQNISAGYIDDPLENLQKRTVFKNVSFELIGGERLAIVGPNGCGKSTLIKVLTGELPPNEGKISWGVGNMIYFNRVLDELNGNETVLQNLNTNGSLMNVSRKRVLKFIKLLGFSEFNTKEKIMNLSGGQRARVALAKCLLSGCTTIILDEPTNHLDILSIQAIECALMNFPGSVILVSHDTFFIDKTATQLLVYTDGTFINYRGSMTMYNNFYLNKA